jgi:cyclopropane-fatty-acyl-phospholipid synthase
MTSTQREVEVAYDISNEFFRLWLDESMHYTSASYLTGSETLEEAQRNKSKILADYAGVTPDSLTLDIGCGWGANLEYLSARGVKRAHGITLSTAQHEEIMARKLPGVTTWVCDYKDYVAPEPYDSLISIEMIDHLCSPAQARAGQAVELYRTYFQKCATWVKPGATFGFQAILRDRIPRTRADIADLKFTADVIFPGGLNPRMEELVAAVRPYWEIVELRTQRECYGRTTAEWLRRMRSHEKTIRERWGDKLFDDYDRYLSTCVRAFANEWSSDVQMKLRQCRSE